MTKQNLCQILGLVLLIGLAACKGHSPAEAGNDNPVFQSDPQLKKITDVLIQSPNDAALYVKRGALLHARRMDSLALKDYVRATTLDSSKSEYFSAVADLMFEHKDITGAIAWIQKSIKVNPQDHKSHVKIGKLFLYLKDFPNSIKELDVALRQDVHDPEAYFLKGLNYKYMKDTNRAMSNFYTALNQQPDYKDALVQLGLIYSVKKDSLALRFLDNAYAADSTDVFPLYARGVFFQNNHELERAKQEFRRCVLRNSHFVDAYFNTGYILLRQDSLQKALRQYDIATKIDYANPTAFYNRGFCYEALDSMPQAVADYKRALAMDTSYKSPKEALVRLKVKI